MHPDSGEKNDWKSWSLESPPNPLQVFVMPFPTKKSRPKNASTARPLNARANARAAKKPPQTGEAILKQLQPPPTERNEAEVMEFLKAIDNFKRRTNKLFPSWSDILDILKGLGYRKV